jgi:hypothetical protein
MHYFALYYRYYTMNNTFIFGLFKTTITVILPITGFFSVQAQYYYKDIITTQQISQSYQQYERNHISRVNVSAFDRNLPVTDAVVLQQTVNTSQHTVVTYTKAPDTDESWLKSYYNQSGLLIKTTDSSAEAVTRSLYQYNNKGLLTTITSKTEPVNNPSLTEVHQWMYGANDKPEKMLKIKNGTDTTTVSFVTDEQGNIGEEKAVRKGLPASKTYYYYDPQNRLTDIARYNKRADKILPDYIFEYNDANQLVKMIVFPEGMPGNYQTWRYTYNASGLKTLEQCFNKQKEMVGKAEYSYQFGK